MFFPLLKMGTVLLGDSFYLIFPNLDLNTTFSTSLCLLLYLLPPKTLPTEAPDSKQDLQGQVTLRTSVSHT